jgi:tetratricopeptide (TPR) repeat protein
MRGRAIVDVRRLVGKEEALLEDGQSSQAAACPGSAWLCRLLWLQLDLEEAQRTHAVSDGWMHLGSAAAPPLSCGFPSGLAHAERPLSLRRHSFASRPQDANTLSWLIRWPSATISEAFYRGGPTVKQRITTLVACGLLAVAQSGVAAAGPLEDGQAAYQRGDFATALQIFRPLAEQGNAAAQRMLGAAFASGQGVPQDFVQAVIWYSEAADQGDLDAQSNLGAMYANGRGVPQDYAQAVVLYRQAGERGNASAQSNLGLMYEHGQGVPQDYVSAHMWLNLAATSPATDPAARDQAARERDMLAAKMTPAQIAEAQRLASELRPKK